MSPPRILPASVAVVSNGTRAAEPGRFVSLHPRNLVTGNQTYIRHPRLAVFGLALRAAWSIRRMIKLVLAPIRGLIRFPLVQLAIAIGLILWLQAADEKSVFGQIFYGLDKLVESTV